MIALLPRFSPFQFRKCSDTYSTPQKGTSNKSKHPPLIKANHLQTRLFSNLLDFTHFSSTTLNRGVAHPCGAGPCVVGLQHRGYRQVDLPQRSLLRGRHAHSLWGLCAGLRDAEGLGAGAGTEMPGGDFNGGEWHFAKHFFWTSNEIDTYYSYYMIYSGRSVICTYMFIGFFPSWMTPHLFESKLPSAFFGEEPTITGQWVNVYIRYCNV